MKVISKNTVVKNALSAQKKAINNKIVIKPSSTADTRTATEKVSIEQLKESSEQHIDDVRRGMNFVASLIKQCGKDHDWTKIRYLKSFYEQFSSAQETGVWGNGWFDKVHVKQERHHLCDRVPSDVNLIDVIEHIVDCVMAGKGRAGSFTPDLLGAGVLERAYANTQKLIADAVVVES